MIEFTFEGHALTLDNLAGVASGHCDVALAEQGIEYARTKRRAHYADKFFDEIYTSDTQRAYDTAKLIFDGRDIPIFQDARLRECDYGEYEGRPRAEMEAFRPGSLSTPFPRGESYEQVALRMRDFFDFVVKKNTGNQILLVGHMATIWMLDFWLNDRKLEEVVGEIPQQRTFNLIPEDWATLRARL